MKKLLYLFAAVTLLASCAQEEVLVDTPVANPTAPRLIGFETFVNKSTRATGTNSTALNDFYTTFNVYGWKTVNGDVSNVFNNVPVEFFAADAAGKVVYTAGKPSDEWTFTADSWYYENIRYWDQMASDYLFSAYVPAAASSDVSCTEDGLIKIGSATDPIIVDDTNLMETPATALAYTGFDYDYMTATSDDLTSTGVIASPVSLNFEHLQAKLNIRIQLDDAVNTAQNVAIQKIEVHNLGDKAYYSNQATSGVSGWNLGAATETYVPTADNVYSLNDATTNYNGYYVLEQLIIPQNCTKYTGTDIPSLSEYQVACLYVEYTIGDETFKSYTPLANIFLDATSTEGKYSFEGGNQYTINVIVGPKPIYFEASVTKWEDAIENNLDMN
ncbi:MAG: fimbrillin family protein [Bacteroides sp.]|nr:fimbrillin family protein [Bacteroides sp.]